METIANPAPVEEQAVQSLDLTVFETPTEALVDVGGVESVASPEVAELLSGHRQRLVEIAGERADWTDAKEEQIAHRVAFDAYIEDVEGVVDSLSEQGSQPTEIAQFLLAEKKKLMHSATLERMEESIVHSAQEKLARRKGLALAVGGVAIFAAGALFTDTISTPIQDFLHSQEAVSQFGNIIEAAIPVAAGFAALAKAVPKKMFDKLTKGLDRYDVDDRKAFKEAIKGVDDAKKINDIRHKFLHEPALARTKEKMAATLGMRILEGDEGKLQPHEELLAVFKEDLGAFLEIKTGNTEKRQGLISSIGKAAVAAVSSINGLGFIGKISGGKEGDVAVAIDKGAQNLREKVKSKRLPSEAA